MIGDMEYPEYGPAIKLEWWDGFGNHVTHESTLCDETIWSLASALRDALRGIGFADESVDEMIISEEID